MQCKVYADIHGVPGDEAEICGSGPWSAEYFGSAEKLRIFRRRYTIGTLTNKANITIQYYLVTYLLSIESKTRDLEWPLMGILR